MKITKAVFPAAGLGTRFLPVTKSIPKEMLPVVDKPLIQYCVEEAKDSGIKEIIFITGRGKRAIEDHFDASVELENFLKKKNSFNSGIKGDVPQDLQYVYTRQKRPRGLGHAILCSRGIVGNETFAVFLSDDIISSKVPVMKQMLGVFKKYNSSILAVERVPREKTHLYGIIKGSRIENGVYRVIDLVEKPEKNPPSNLAIIGRYILTPAIFAAIEKTPPGKGGEMQLTDAIKTLLEKEEVYALEFEGDRYDAGDRIGFIKANILFGLKRARIKEELRKFIRRLVSGQ